MSAIPVYIALLHYPIINRNGQVVTTAVTNMDIHDISRTARTFEIKKFFIVTPIIEQHTLIERILAHWMRDSARKVHPDRVEAVALVSLAYTFSEVKEAIVAQENGEPLVVLTDARKRPGQISEQELRKRMQSESETQPYLIVFGTGWGVAEEFYPQVHVFLKPIYGPNGPDGYNHLSVRAAAAVILDRLFGT